MMTRTYLRHIGCNQEIASIIDHFSYMHPFSLRTLERIAAYCKIVEASLPKGALFVPQIVSILCILRVGRPNLYECARSGNLTYKAIDDFFYLESVTVLPNRTARVPINRDVGNWWLFALGELEDEAIAAELGGGLSYYGISPSRIIPYFCEHIDSFTLPNT
jgi:hypothetical protein